MSSRLFLLVLLSAGAIGVYFALRSPRSTPPTVPATMRSAPTETAPAPVVAHAPLREAPAPTRTPPVPEEMIRYPDGTFMPPLNGVKQPALLHWPPEEPFSPIVGKQMAGDVEWYVHADGTQSTTQMVFRSDLGREVAVTHVARPMPVASEEPVEGSGKD
ncbi:MAG: hypothetical protein IPN34_12960 [Planctomycetes bacterium]|nr:hypothetical protein [Planctomycetota bacterium]